MVKENKTYFYMSELDPDAYTQCPRCKKWKLNTYSGLCENKKCKAVIGD